MKHWYEKPHKQLTEFVRTVLVMEGFSEAGSDEKPVFTNGMPVLFCRMEKSAAESEDIAQLSIGKSSTDGWNPGEQTTIIGYFFKPFAAASLFNVQAKQLSESPIDLSDWSPQKYMALRTQLTYATETARKIEVLDNLLIQQFKENERAYRIIQYATDHIMSHTETEVLAEILEELQLNERTFQRMFKKYVGVTATHYRRICQFQLSFGQLRSKDFDKISDVAFDNGFADQSHFTRTMKEFIQTTPQEYLANGLKGKEKKT